MAILEQLQRHTFFTDVSADDLAALVAEMQTQHLATDEVLFRVGDPGDSLYFIQRGRIQIYLSDTDGSRIPLAYCGEDEFFGELSPIDQRPRSASARAVAPTTLLRLSGAAFLGFIETRPQVGLAIMRSMAGLLRKVTRYLEHRQPEPFAPVRDEHTRRPASPAAARLIDTLNSAPSLPESESDTGNAAPNIFQRAALRSTQSQPRPANLNGGDPPPNTPTADQGKPST